MCLASYLASAADNRNGLAQTIQARLSLRNAAQSLRAAARLTIRRKHDRPADSLSESRQ